ncbi:MAG: DUF72 domain-containing protein, partial [Ignavibacteriales bacterium]|nr:DUF72 domain-containing protein [Ignavibacteriales bacterium]
GFDKLSYYSDYFNSVEVNVTYYTYLNSRIVAGWLDKVEKKNDFQFIIKMHQDFTHKRFFTPEQIRMFRYNLDILDEGGKLAGVLMQFPYSFMFDNSALGYVERLREAFDKYRLFPEVRHKSWLCAEALAYMSEKNLSVCTIDQPQIGQSIPFRTMITTDTAYIRFHGRNVQSWKQSITDFGKKQTYAEQSSRYKYLYSPGELSEIENAVREVFDKVKKVFIIMNNHPSGYAVANAFELLYLLKDFKKLDIPSNTIEHFPRLAVIAS